MQSKKLQAKTICTFRNFQQGIVENLPSTNKQKSQILFFQTFLVPNYHFFFFGDQCGLYNLISIFFNRKFGYKSRVNQSPLFLTGLLLYAQNNFCINGFAEFIQLVIDFSALFTVCEFYSALLAKYDKYLSLLRYFSMLF